MHIREEKNPFQTRQNRPYPLDLYVKMHVLTSKAHFPASIGKNEYVPHTHNASQRLAEFLKMCFDTQNVVFGSIFVKKKIIFKHAKIGPILAFFTEFLPYYRTISRRDHYWENHD